MGLIFFLSAQQADEGLAWWDVLARKIGHVGGYALLTALWAWALSGITGRPVAIAALIAFVYAATDEYHQSFVETRNGSPIDVGVDTIGIALAAWLIGRLPLGAARPSSSVRLSDEI
jgi:VanZ family protein